MMDVYKQIGMNRKALLHQWILAKDFGFNCTDSSGRNEDNGAGKSEGVYVSKSTGKAISAALYQKDRAIKISQGHKAIPWPFPKGHRLLIGSTAQPNHPDILNYQLLRKYIANIEKEGAGTQKGKDLGQLFQLKIRLLSRPFINFLNVQEQTNLFTELGTLKQKASLLPFLKMTFNLINDYPLETD